MLRRFGATPLRPSTLLAAQVAVHLLLTAAGVGLLVLAAWWAYDLRWPAAPLPVALAFLLGSLSFFALAFVVAGLVPTPKAAEAVGSALFFPMLFLSGAAVPRQAFPEAVRRVSDALPLTHAVVLIDDLWYGRSWNLVSLGVVAGMLVAGVAVSVRTFRWE